MDLVHFFNFLTPVGTKNITVLHANFKFACNWASVSKTKNNTGAIKKKFAF